MAHKRLGDLLIEAGSITEEQLELALASQRESGRRLGDELIADGIITETELIDTLCDQLGIDYVDLSNKTLPPELTGVLPRNLARKYDMCPIKATCDEVVVAMSDPMNYIAQEEARAASRRRVIPVISHHAAIERAIMQLYGNEGAARAIEEMRNERLGVTQDSAQAGVSSSVIGDEEEAQSAPTIRLVNSIIERAITERASDVHLEPREGDMQVRMRIDGLMRNVLTVPRELQSSVISRLKIMGNMNIAEHRIPQDGRANVRLKKKDIDLRLSTLPTIYGEGVVVRLLDKSTALLSPEGIGLSGANLEQYQRLVGSTNGVLLITGPTGSGKSSTMYTMIRERNTEEVKLITLEDPVEYNIDGVNQVQINEKAGMTFASSLRSVLRQDPDIIAVGEIRDAETAEIAMRAAITGHLVFSTIHTYDAASAIDRLLDIGVAPYLIASGLRGVVGQRLVRTICPNCRTEYTPDQRLLDLLGLSSNEMPFYHGEGCTACAHTGYRGRTAVFEFLTVDAEMRRIIGQGADRVAVREHLAHAANHKSLPDSCMELVRAGVTTPEEVARIISTMD
ncbi:MAG: GspE/PulE family protein [Coriobacteriia bacterium]|nr:GspE/PulE family protein [Coriobacteriia bacterium]